MSGIIKNCNLGQSSFSTMQNSTGTPYNYGNSDTSMHPVVGEQNQFNTQIPPTSNLSQIYYEVKQLKREIQNMKAVQESLTQRVKKLEESFSPGISSLKKENVKPSVKMCNETKRQNLPSQYANQSSITRNQNDKFVVDIKTERDFKSFTREICESSISEPSLGRKAAQNKFFASWRIERFICSNESAKQADPNIVPEFMTDEVNGYYWAAPLDKPGYYMVYPDPSLSYEQSRHSSKGYKEVFKTGYQNGAYKFIPKVPAVFKKQGNQWHLSCEGELRLELK